MTSRFVQALRNHWPVLLIVPLVVIATTWPTFPRIFDADEFWLHRRHPDHLLRLWDAWHLERVLNGQADYYHTDALFHPTGLSLTFHGTSLPATFLLLLLQKILPASVAFNLLFLLILCFNAMCAYVLALHLVNDAWIATFGAVVVGVSVPLTGVSATPDLIMMGTLPLTIYFLHRSVLECRWQFSALAGLCAGLTVFIGVYIFVIILLSVGMYAIYLSATRWNQPAYWRRLLLFMILCAALGSLRFYPLLADTAVLQEGLERFLGKQTSNDVLDYFVLTTNPFTGELLRNVFSIPIDSSHQFAYLGYTNLFLLGCAIVHMPLWRRLLPWLTMLVFFAVMRLGDFLTINGRDYFDIPLPRYFMNSLLPALFGQIHAAANYQIGVVAPLAILSCFGLGRLIRSTPARRRTIVVLVLMLLVAIESYAPHRGYVVDSRKTAYIDWLHAETDGVNAIIDLPQRRVEPTYYLYLQTLSQLPLTIGHAWRTAHSAKKYIRDNFLLAAWNSNRSVHCLPYHQAAFQPALEQLLTDGASHVVVHTWRYGDQFIIHSFANIPPSYDDGFVRVYRLRDLRLSCETSHIEPPRLRHFARSPSAIPGARSAILSLHPSQPVDPDRFDYLASLFSDWASLLHLYQDDGELAMQNAGAHYTDVKTFISDNQVIHFLYNTGDTDPDLLISQTTFDEFNLCQREAQDDGAVIEHYVSREFSCELVASDNPFQVQYDNGIQLENLKVTTEQDVLDLQFMWSSLPDETHSLSIQLFNAAGAKVFGQDSVISHVTLDRHRIDIADLDPGNYEIKLIVYNYVTGKTVAGTQTATGVRFDRELIIADLNHI